MTCSFRYHVTATYLLRVSFRALHATLDVLNPHVNVACLETDQKQET